MLRDLEELRLDIQERVEEMPKHASFVARYANAQPPTDAILHEAEERL
jgi:hypothetical protein